MKLQNLLEAKSKYTFVDGDIKTLKNGTVVKRIQALKHFSSSDIKKGDLGGYIESEENLSQDNNCWVYKTSIVYGKTKIIDNANIKPQVSINCDMTIGGDSYISPSECWFIRDANLDSLQNLPINLHISNTVKLHTLAIISCPLITKLDWGGKIETLDLKFLKSFSFKNLPDTLIELKLTSIKELLNLPYLVAQKMNIEFSGFEKQFLPMLPYIRRFQQTFNSKSSRLKAMMEFQDILMMNLDFSKEVCEI